MHPSCEPVSTNWWKWGCIASLVAFEGAREIAVVGSAAPLPVFVLASVKSYGTLTFARGQWARIDGGEDLIPSVVNLQCDAEKGECIAASQTLSSNSQIPAPEIEQFPATFTVDAISFSDSSSGCADYSYRIDLKLKKVFSVREKKAHPEPLLPGMCDKLEPRIEMTLADSKFATRESFTKDRFLPILNGVSWLGERLSSKPTT